MLNNNRSIAEYNYYFCCFFLELLQLSLEAQDRNLIVVAEFLKFLQAGYYSGHQPILSKHWRVDNVSVTRVTAKIIYIILNCGHKHLVHKIKYECRMELKYILVSRNCSNQRSTCWLQNSSRAAGRENNLKPHWVSRTPRTHRNQTRKWNPNINSVRNTDRWHEHTENTQACHSANYRQIIHSIYVYSITFSEKKTTENNNIYLYQQRSFFV